MKGARLQQTILHLCIAHNKSYLHSKNAASALIPKSPGMAVIPQRNKRQWLCKIVKMANVQQLKLWPLAWLILQHQFLTTNLLNFLLKCLLQVPVPCDNFVYYLQTLRRIIVKRHASIQLPSQIIAPFSLTYGQQILNFWQALLIKEWLITAGCLWQVLIIGLWMAKSWCFA